jgi:hypothetical protein
MGRSVPQVQEVEIRLTPAERALLVGEFENLGIDAVRRSVFRQVWSGDKLQAAREWIEEFDARQWQAAGYDGSRKRRWMSYAAAVVGCLYMILRLVRLMKFGL